jgi:hypothetical protein
MSESKKTQKIFTELHLVSSMSIDDAQRCVTLLENKGVDVTEENIEEDRAYYRLRERHKQHSVYLRLSRWNDTQTRIGCTLTAPRFTTMVLGILIVLVIGIVTAAVIEFIISRSILYSLFFGTWFCVMFYVFLVPKELGLGLLGRGKYEAPEIGEAQRSRSYLLDAIIEVFKTHGELFPL